MAKTTLRKTSSQCKKARRGKMFGFGDMVGTRAQVWACKKHHTSGGLMKAQLRYKAQDGRIKSRRASEAAKLRFNSDEYAYVKQVFAENKAPLFVKKAAKAAKASKSM